METVQSRDGTTIAYERAGSGPPLVLLHGAGADHTLYAPLLSRLQASFTTHAVDRRGHGASGDAPTYAPEREVEDALAVLEAIGDDVDLVGHSSGAVLALMVAPHTRRVRRLALYEPPLDVQERRHSPTLAGWLRAILASGDELGATRTFLREGPGMTERELDRLEQSPAWPSFLAAARTYPYDAELVAGYALDPEALRAIAMPTLLVLGDASPPFVRAGVEALASALPHRRLVVLPGQGHAAHRSAPDVLAREIEAFFVTQSA